MPNFVKNYKEKGKDIELIRAIRNRQRKKYYDQTAKYKKHKFTLEDDIMILEKRMLDRELSDLIGHSVQSIQIRRSRLKHNINKNEHK